MSFGGLDCVRRIEGAARLAKVIAAVAGIVGR
jgi:hypothetical protein